MSETVNVRNEFDNQAIAMELVAVGPSTTLEDLKIAALKNYNDLAGSAGIPEEDWDYYVIHCARGECPDQTELVAPYRHLSYFTLKETE